MAYRDRVSDKLREPNGLLGRCPGIEVEAVKIPNGQDGVGELIWRVDLASAGKRVLSNDVHG